jgi:hypothetical protein
VVVSHEIGLIELKVVVHVSAGAKIDRITPR